MPKHRIQRVSEEIKKCISAIIREELKDPDIPALCSVMDVECTSDLKHAKVYISIYGQDADLEKAMKALRRSAGMLRSQISRRMSTRTVPELHFVLDSSISHSIHIAEILEKLQEGEKDE